MYLKIILILLVLYLIFILQNQTEKFTNLTNKIDKKIIIVGNAPFDKKNKRGKFIDSFEKVVRFNSFKLDNFSEYLGDKIDEWVVSDTHCLLHNKLFIQQNKTYPNIKINIILPMVFKNNVNKLKKKLPLSIFNKSIILIQDDDIIVDKKYNFGRRWPSTGILAIYHYLNYYDKIYLTGFNHFDPNEKTIHYYENRKQIGHQHHLEKKIVDNLVKEKRIIRI